jgi:hypothetical protein
MGYTVPLALQDYMTVIFSAFGLTLLTRMTWQMEPRLGQMALLGLMLTVTGGIAKATGKLVLAAGGPDIAWLNLGLFPFIAPGLTLIAWALYQVRRMFRRQAPLRQPWLVPILLLAIVGAGVVAIGNAGGPWRVPLILLSAMANVSLLAMLIAAAWRRKMWFTGSLFLINLTVILVMAWLTSIPTFSIALVWTEQIVQTISQMLFTVGAWQYGGHMLTSYRQQLVAQPA